VRGACEHGVDGAKEVEIERGGSEKALEVEKCDAECGE
jgi:hypothetical protein